MKRTILDGPYRPQIFLAPDNPGGGTGDGKEKQTEEPEVVDPFKDIDLDLLDENTRKAILAAREELKKVPAMIKQTRGFQSSYDKAMAELQRLQTASQQQQQQPKKEDEPQTLEEQIAADYMAEGVDEASAKRAARILAKTLGRTAGATQKYIQEQVQPVAISASLTEATQNFSQAQNSDRRIAEHPEVAQAVWERVEAAAKEGKVLSPQMIANIGKVIFQDHLDAGTIKITPTPPPVTKTTPDQSTRFTFPGATHQKPTARPFQQSSTDELDPETAAAVLVTKNLMRQSFTNTTKK